MLIKMVLQKIVDTPDVYLNDVLLKKYFSVYTWTECLVK